MTAVLDASFAIDWLLADDGSDMDEPIVRLGPEGLIVPVIFWHEAASALRNLTLKRVIRPAQRMENLARLEQLAIVVDDAKPSMSAILAICDRFALTVYDAAYLDLAIRTGSSLATRDAALIAAARRQSIDVSK